MGGDLAKKKERKKASEASGYNSAIDWLAGIELTHPRNCLSNSRGFSPTGENLKTTRIPDIAQRGFKESQLVQQENEARPFTMLEVCQPPSKSRSEISKPTAPCRTRPPPHRTRPLPQPSRPGTADTRTPGH